jgi:hypothetical protein
MAGECPCCGKPIDQHPASGRESLARLLYEADRDYCARSGSGRFPPWDAAGEWTKGALRAVADAVLAAGYRRAES